MIETTVGLQRGRQRIRKLGGIAISSTAVKVILVAAVAGAMTLLALALVSPSYDSLYSLAWGQILSKGVRPDLQEPLAPLAHPLPIGVSALLGVAGPNTAFTAFTILAGLSFAFLGYGAYRLARALSPQRSEAASAALGLVVVALILTRVRLDYFAMKASLEIPFTGLVLLALALVLESPRRRPWLPLALLVPAGLLRPDSWLLGLAYCGWLAYSGLRGRRLAVCLALAIAPVALWLSFAGFMTGDPISPLTGNPAAVSIDEFGFSPPPPDQNGGLWVSQIPNIIDRTTDVARILISDGVAIPAMLVVVSALVLVASRRPGSPRVVRFAIVAGIVVFLLVQTMVLGEIGAPVVERYAITAAVLLLTLVVAAVWALPRPEAAILASVGLLLVVTTGLLNGPPNPIWPSLPKLRQKASASHRLRIEQNDLYRLASAPAVAKATGRTCVNVTIGGRGGIYAVLWAKPLVAHALETDPKHIRTLRAPRGKLRSSNFRRDLPHGPKPFLKEGKWAFRSPCLKSDYNLKRKLRAREALAAGRGQ
jgi:hypothetical protein